MTNTVFPLSLFLISSVAAPQTARADWDDATPAWADKNAKSEVTQTPQPKLIRIESDEEWSKRQHTPQEFEARARMLQALNYQRQMAKLQEQLRPKLIPWRPGTPIPGTPSYTQQGVFSNGAEQSPFFGGISPQQAAQALSRPVYHFDVRDTSPAWAKQKVETRHFVDGVEKFGKEDPMGFF